MILTCRVCGREFKTEDKRRKYCGVACYRVKASREPGPGAFRAGSEPWNKGRKGIHLSPATEFKPGMRSNRAAPVGAVKIRNDHGRPRAWVKVAEPNTWRLRAQVAWEGANGPIPPGHIVHHHDRNTLNDSPDNLELLSRAAHLSEHRPEFEEKRRAHAAGQSLAGV